MRPDTHLVQITDLTVTSCVTMWHQPAGLKRLFSALKLLPRNHLQNNRELLTDFSNTDDAKEKEEKSKF